MAEFLKANVESVSPNHYRFDWQLDTAAEIKISYIDADQTLIELGVSADTSLDVDLDTNAAHRPFFKLNTDNHSILIAERRFLLDGMPNMRDFGGYPSYFGGIVKWGVLFRSGRLSTLSKSDQAFIDSLGLSVVFDFRREQEIQYAPSNLGAGSKVLLKTSSITPGNHIGFIDMLERGDLLASTAEQAMVAIFEDLALNQANAYAPVFRQLINASDPVLIHCSAGKDRTGVMAALILLLLGVSREVIMEDYLLTARYYPTPEEYDHIRESFNTNLPDPEAIEPLMTVKACYLQAVFDVIDTNFSSESDYFETVFGLNKGQQQKIIEHYLEK